MLDDKCPARLREPNADITAFKGATSVFSNFFPCRLKVFDHVFLSSEHAYQYMKCMRCGRPEIAELILRCLKAGRENRANRRASRENKLKEQWPLVS